VVGGIDVYAVGILGLCRDLAYYGFTLTGDVLLLVVGNLGGGTRRELYSIRKFVGEGCWRRPACVAVMVREGETVWMRPGPSFRVEEEEVVRSSPGRISWGKASCEGWSASVMVQVSTSIAGDRRKSFQRRNSCRTRYIEQGWSNVHKTIKFSNSQDNCHSFNDTDTGSLYA
jgi:hypothetical protein